MARAAIKHEGLLVGGSSGSALAGAHAYIKANEEALKGKRVVVLCADSIRNYMSKFLDDKWMEDYGFDPAAEPAGADLAAAAAKEAAAAPKASVLLERASEMRLRELASARRKGAISQADFEAERKSLLKRLGPPRGDAGRSSLNAP